MAFTVQDDDGSIDNANSLVTVEEFQDYHEDRGKDYTNTITYPEATIKAALIRSTDYLNSRWKYQGEKMNKDQGTCFPRYYIYDLDGQLVDKIPDEIKKDCYELAAYLIDNALTSLYGDITAEENGVKVKKSKIDVIEETIEYFGKVDYQSLVVGNAQNAKASGFLVIPSGIYI